MFICTIVILYVLRLKKGCFGETVGLHIASAENKGPGQRRAGAPKLPFAPLENLCNPGEGSHMMAHRRSTFDLHGKENSLSVGSMLPRSSGGNGIKAKISLWEGKEPSISLGHSNSTKKTETMAQNNCKSAEEQNAESCWTGSYKEKENVGKVNGDSRPCSPVETGEKLDGTLKRNKPYENQKGNDCNRVVHKEMQDLKKENDENLGDLRSHSPTVTLQQVGTLRKSTDRRTANQTGEEKRAVFTLFKKLEAMGENYGKTPTELGNYFSPPAKDKQIEVKKKESEGVNQISSAKPPGAREEMQNQENLYTEPGAPPINPVPKPQRTFQHPASSTIGKSQRLGRGQRNLPPLPSISMKTSSKPPSGVYRRPRGERVRDNLNRYIEK